YHQICRLPMLICELMVIGCGVGAGVAIAATGAALGLGATLGLADGRGVALGVGARTPKTGGSANGVSRRRSTVRAYPSDSARSSSASVYENVVRRRSCATFAVSVPSGETQSRSPASRGA